MPSTVIPLYTMVSFSRIRYSEALARFNRQTNWFEAGLNALRVAGVAATFAGIFYLKRHLIANK